MAPYFLDDVMAKTVDKEDEVASVLLNAEREELEALRNEKADRMEAEMRREKAEKVAAESITIDLPPAAGVGINLAGVRYTHGRSYQVDNSTKWAIEEAQRRAWAHEASLKESENKGRAKRRAYLS